MIIRFITISFILGIGNYNSREKRPLACFRRCLVTLPYPSSFHYFFY